jgi:hypothetical protein
MAIHLALRTLKAMNDCLEADQGAAYRTWLKQVLPHMADAYRGLEKNANRQHMGASAIGKDCARAIWYGFRWFSKPHFEGRILRLFNRGHLEEARFIALMLSIDTQIYQQDANGKQFRISDVGGHFGGSGDGVAMGLPDFPPLMTCLLEFKTHNDKSFTKLAGKSYGKYLDGIFDATKPQIAFDGEGVASAKYEHYVQMQVYMRKMGINVAVYGAVNKNDDHIYLEIVPIDTRIGDQFIDRGRQLILLQEPPKKINNSPGWFECKFCDHRPVCHLGKPPERNCRTCFYSRANEDGNWYCMDPIQEGAIGRDEPLDEQAQMLGCEHYTKLT